MLQTSLIPLLFATALAADPISETNDRWALYHVLHAVTILHGGASTYEDLPVLCTTQINDRSAELTDRARQRGETVWLDTVGLDFSFAPDLSASFPADVYRMVAEWNSQHPNHQYRTEPTPGLVHVIPSRGLDEQCRLVGVTSLLDTRIFKRNEPRTPMQVERDVADEIARLNPTPEYVDVTTMQNGSQYHDWKVNIDTEHARARDVLYSVVRRMDNGQRGFALMHLPGQHPGLSLTIYHLGSSNFKPPASGDIDADGVRNLEDECQRTPPFADVDARGCVRIGDKPAIVGP